MTEYAAHRLDTQSMRNIKRIPKGNHRSTGLGEVAKGYIDELADIGEDGINDRLKSAVQIMLAKEREPYVLPARVQEKKKRRWWKWRR